jgi:hypothetical protein
MCPEMVVMYGKVAGGILGDILDSDVEDWDDVVYGL